MVVFLKRLKYSDGSFTGERYIVRGVVPLRRAVEKAGVMHDLDTVLDGNAVVSRQHGSLTAIDGKFVLLDKGSRNKTWVKTASSGHQEQVQLEPNEGYELDIGDIFSLGPFAKASKPEGKDTSLKKQALVFQLVEEKLCICFSKLNRTDRSKLTSAAGEIGAEVVKEMSQAQIVVTNTFTTTLKILHAIADPEKGLVTIDWFNFISNGMPAVRVPSYEEFAPTIDQEMFNEVKIAPFSEPRTSILAGYSVLLACSDDERQYKEVLELCGAKVVTGHGESPSSIGDLLGDSATERVPCFFYDDIGSTHPARGTLVEQAVDMHLNWLTSSVLARIIVSNEKADSGTMLRPSSMEDVPPPMDKKAQSQILGTQASTQATMPSQVLLPPNEEDMDEEQEQEVEGPEQRPKRRGRAAALQPDPEPKPEPEPATPQEAQAHAGRRSTRSSARNKASASASAAAPAESATRATRRSARTSASVSSTATRKRDRVESTSDVLPPPPPASAIEAESQAQDEVPAPLSPGTGEQQGRQHAKRRRGEIVAAEAEEVQGPGRAKGKGRAEPLAPVMELEEEESAVAKPKQADKPDEGLFAGKNDQTRAQHTEQETEALSMAASSPERPLAAGVEEQEDGEEWVDAIESAPEGEGEGVGSNNKAVQEDSGGEGAAGMKITVDEDGVEITGRKKGPRQAQGQGQGQGQGREEPEVEMQVVAMEEDNEGWKSAPSEAQRKAICRQRAAARAASADGDGDGVCEGDDEDKDEDGDLTPVVIVQDVVDPEKLELALEAEAQRGSSSSSVRAKAQSNDTRCFRKNYVRLADPLELVSLDPRHAKVEGVRVTDRDQDRDEASQADREAAEQEHQEEVDGDEVEAGMFADEFAVPTLPTSGGGRGWR